MSSELLDYWETSKNFSMAFAYDNGVQITAVGVTVLFIALVVYICYRFPGEEKKMTRGDYVLSKRMLKQLERTMIADAVAEMLLNLFSKGKLSAERYQYWHLRFGANVPLKELLPVKLTPEQLKLAMKRRVGNGVYKPVPFFKEGPKTKKPRNKLDAILQQALKPTA